jgi:hypothetical protein
MHFLGGVFACFAAAATQGAVAGGQGPTDAPPVAAEEPWVSSTGSGLLSLPDTSTLAPKHLNLDFTFDNQDRDPLRLDVVDYAIAWNYGVRSGLETYGHVVVSRAVIVSDRPTILPPPVDIVIPDGMPVPRRPYYLLYAPFPYVNRTGSSQLSRFVPGDAVLGGKMRLSTPHGWHPGLAATLELKLPMTGELPSLQSGAGTGGFDQTVRFTAEWRRPRQSFVTSLGLTHVGQPPFGDQLIVFQPGGGAQGTAAAFHLASRLHLGLGFRHVLKPSVALVGEITKVVGIGSHTPVYTAAGPLDVTLGSQLRRGRFHLTVGVRYHANSVPAFRTRPSPFAGMADLTSVAPNERDAYLDAIGADNAIPYVRDRAQIVAAIPAHAPPLPEGARVLPPVFTVQSHDRIASTLVLGWSFGTAHKK